MAYNSTIKQRTGICVDCTSGAIVPVIGRREEQRCDYHYKLHSKLKSLAKQSEKELKSEDGLPELIDEADILVSRYLRLSSADENGNCHCYTCEWVGRWQDCDAGHFIPRANMFMRFDLARNIRIQCHDCNRYKRGNRMIFARNLDAERAGLSDLLIEESLLVYHITREEVRQIISEYGQKLSQLKRA